MTDPLPPLSPPHEDPLPKPRRSGRGVVRSSFTLLIGRGGGAALSAVWLVYAARQLGVRRFGDLALLLAVYGMFAVVADLGLSVLIAGRTAEIGAIDPALLRSVLSKRLMGAVVTALAVAIGFNLAASQQSVLVPLLFAGSIFGNAIHSTYSSVLRSVGRVWPEGLNEVASRAAVLVGGVLLLHLGGGLGGAVFVYSAADLASSFALWRVVRGELQKQAGTAGAAPITLPEALPLGIASGIGGMYYRIDAWLLGLLVGAAATGLYSAAYRLVEALLLPATVVGAVAIGQLGGLSGIERRSHLLRMLGGAVAVTAVLALGAAGFSSRLMEVLFGPEFEPASDILRLLLLSAVPGAVVAALGPAIAVGRSRGYAAALSFALMSNIVANLTLIPRWGGTGAALANLVSQSLLALLLLFYLLTGTKQARGHGLRNTKMPQP